MSDVSIYDKTTILIIRLPARFDAVCVALRALSESYPGAFVTYDQDGNMAIVEGASDHESESKPEDAN